MRTIKVRIDADVLLSDLDFDALNLDNRVSKDSLTLKIDSYVASHPLLSGRESTVRVGVFVPKVNEPELEAVAA